MVVIIVIGTTLTVTAGGVEVVNRVRVSVTVVEVLGITVLVVVSVLERVAVLVDVLDKVDFLVRTVVLTTVVVE